MLIAFLVHQQLVFYRLENFYVSKLVYTGKLIWWQVKFFCCSLLLFETFLYIIYSYIRLSTDSFVHNTTVLVLSGLIWNNILCMVFQLPYAQHTMLLLNLSFMWTALNGVITIHNNNYGWRSTMCWNWPMISSSKVWLCRQSAVVGKSFSTTLACLIFVQLLYKIACITLCNCTTAVCLVLCICASFIWSICAIVACQCECFLNSWSATVSAVSVTVSAVVTDLSVVTKQQGQHFQLCVQLCVCVTISSTPSALCLSVLVFV